MESLRPSYHESGLPRWVLFASIPLVLVLGLIAGMALATYTEDPRTPAAEKTAPNAPQANPAAGTVQPGPRTDLSWQIPPRPVTGNPLPNTSTQPGHTPGLTPGPQTLPTQPQRAYFTEPPHDIREAGWSLTTYYRTYQSDSILVSFDYQQMRHEAGHISLVGLIRAADYADWAKALQENPARLKQWLEQAAARVQPAASRDRFFLAWAVVDVLPERPSGYADHEVTALTNGSYLVIRPLAATVDYAKSEIALRPIASLAQAASGRVTAPGGPWETYGPVLRFDSTDLYNPAQLIGARPRN